MSSGQRPHSEPDSRLWSTAEEYAVVKDGRGDEYLNESLETYRCPNCGNDYTGKNIPRHHCLSDNNIRSSNVQYGYFREGG